MEETEIERMELNGKPYFIVEAEGGFFVAKSVSYEEKGVSKHTVNPDLEIGKLELGLDIIEVPTRSLSLLVKMSVKENLFFSVVDALRKFAGLAGYDFVIYELFGKGLSRFISHDGTIDNYEVIPRLFKRPVND